MLDVINIVLNPHLDGGIPAKPVHLRPAGHARTDLVLDHVLWHTGLEPLHIVGNLRARTDQAHISLQHVQKLRQLIQRKLPHPCTEMGPARITVGTPRRILFLVDIHGAKFVHEKPFLALSHPFLSENHRSGRGQLHPSRTDRHHRQKNQKQQQ